MPVEPARRPATAGAAAPAPPPKASAPTTVERIPALAELPEDLRRQMPTLTVSGLVHSANPAHRLDFARFTVRGGGQGRRGQHGGQHGRDDRCFAEHRS